MGRTGFGGRLSVAAASGLLTLCLAGGPLYVSSSATAALDERLDRTCPADAGLLMLLNLGDTRVTDVLAERLPEIEHLGTRIDTRQSLGITYWDPDNDDGLRRRVILLHRTDHTEHIDGPTDQLRPGTLMLPAYLMDAALGLAAGDELAVQAPGGVTLGSDGTVIELPTPPPTSAIIAGPYQPVPVRPEPAYWCALRRLFRPLPSGDQPTPVGFVSTPEETMPGGFALESIELWIDREGLSRVEALRTAEQLNALVAELAKIVGAELDDIRVDADVRTGLGPIAEYAGTLSQLVRRTVQPVRLAGVLASVGLLMAAAVLLAREQRRELRLRQLRGETTVRTFGRQVGANAITGTVGAAGGLLGAIIAVRQLGPSPELEPDPTRQAFVWTAVGFVAATLLVAGVVTAASTRLVDPRPARGRWLRYVPWELAVVALAVGSYVRLDKVGGVRLLGSEARGGDLLALAFPVVAVLAPVVVLARPAAALARRLRFTGRRLWFPLRLGVRRVMHEGWTSTILAAAVAVAAGTFVIAGTLTESAEGMLKDKAAAYLGTDLVLTLRNGADVPTQFPAELAGKATVVRRTQGTIDGVPVDVLGIDPGTFVDGARWRSDAIDGDIDDLLAQVTAASSPAGPWPVVLANGDFTSTTIELRNRDFVALAPIAEANWFPGVQTGTGQVVVNAEAFTSGVMPGNAYVWVRDPPDGVVELLADAGFEVRAAQATEDVFEVTSFLAVSWSYDAFKGLGLLVAIVTLVAEVVVLQARRTSRQSAFVVTERMGVNRWHHAVALLVEIAVPIVVGAVVGVTAAIVARRASVRRLDTLRHLKPPAQAHVDTGSLVLAGAGLLVALAILVTLGVVSAWRAKPMEVMRGTA